MDEKEKEIAALRAIYDEEKKVRTCTCACYVLRACDAYAYAMHMGASYDKERSARLPLPDTPTCCGPGLRRLRRAQLLG